MARAAVISKVGRDFITHLEGGGHLTAYHDQIGLTTIGVGHLLSRSELLSGKIGLTMYVPWRDGLDADQVDELFEQDLRPIELAIQQYVRRVLTQNQVDALASFIFSVGVQAFHQSTLLKRLNAGELAAVPQEMLRWVHAGGKVLDDLKWRRQREVGLWNALPEGPPPAPDSKEV